MIEIFFVLIVVILVSGLCLHHRSMQLKLYQNNNQNAESVRKAAEHSIMAANTVNPILALLEVTKAIQIIQGLHERYGIQEISSLTHVDTDEMMNIIQNQKQRIMQDMASAYPKIIPPHPLREHAGMVVNAEIQGD